MIGLFNKGVFQKYLQLPAAIAGLLFSKTDAFKVYCHIGRIEASTLLVCKLCNILHTRYSENHVQAETP